MKWTYVKSCRFSTRSSTQFSFHTLSRNWFDSDRSLTHDSCSLTAGGYLKYIFPTARLVSKSLWRNAVLNSTSYLADLYVLFFQKLTVNKFSIKCYHWFDTNHRPLVLEVTSLPTEPQALGTRFFLRVFCICRQMHFHHLSVYHQEEGIA